MMTSYRAVDPSLRRSFDADEVHVQLTNAGVASAVVIQAINCKEETAFLLDIAGRHDWICGVVGWLPLMRPREVEVALEQLAADPEFVGVRHLINSEPDADWIIQPAVLDSLALIAERGLPFDLVAVVPRHLEHVPALIDHVPDLRLVIDHLGKPPIREGKVEPWRSVLARAAEHPNVYGKISGLTTIVDRTTRTAFDIGPYVGVALELFGPQRLMFGSDWPVALLSGDYALVWRETLKSLESLVKADRDAILETTARAFYLGNQRGAC